jgi:hypothetical protein
MNRRLATFALSVVLAAGVHGDDRYFEDVLSAGDLHASCISEDRSRAAACAGYLLGIVEAAIDSRDTFPGVTSPTWVSFADVCIPPGPRDPAEYVDVFVEWMSERPEIAQNIAANTVLLAFSDQWPCTQEWDDTNGQPGETLI